MITFKKLSGWALAIMVSTALVFIASCGEDEEPEPDPIIPPTVSYTDTDVAIGSVGEMVPAIQGDLPIAYTLTDAGDAADFVSVDAVTGAISVAKESVIGTYDIVVKATNLGGSSETTASLTISISPDFDPRGMEVYWKYFMNNTSGITLLRLDLLDDELPAAFPLPDGWPTGWPAIDPTDQTLPSYLVFTGINESILQVPGDDACLAYVEAGEDSVYRGDTLLIIVNQDLTLSTVCRKKSDENTTVTTEIGTSTITYANDGFVWTLNVVLQGILPLQISIADAAIVSDYVDPLWPHYSAPSGTGGMYDAITGNVPQYMTVEDYTFMETGDLPTAFIFLDVDVVMEIVKKP